MASQVRTFNKTTLHSWQVLFVLFGLFAVVAGFLMYFQAAAQRHIRQTDGTMASLEGIYRVGSGKYARNVRGSRAECGDTDLCGDYQYSVLAIYEDAVEYHIDPSWFQPALPRWFAEDGERVHFWYTSGPLADSQIVAVTLHDKTYTTDDYTHPQSHSLTTATWATILVLPGLGLLLLGIFFPRIALRRPGLAENLQLYKKASPRPSQHHHKYKPIRPVTRVAKGAPRPARRRAHR